MTAAVGWLEVVVLLGVWAWALWSPVMRSGRTVATLIGVTIAYLLLSTVPGVPVVVIRVVLLCAVVALLLLRSSRFLLRTAEDLAFDRSYTSAQRRLTDLSRLRLSGEIDRAAFADGVARTVPEFANLVAPDEEWASLLRDTVAELRAWLAAGGADLNVSEPELHVSQLRERHARIRSARSRLKW